MSLTAERTALATVDEELIGLLLERAKILRNIAYIKQATKTAILQQDEWEIRHLKRCQLLSEFPDAERLFVLEVFRDLHTASIHFQESQL